MNSESGENWKKIIAFVETNFNKKPDMNALLFLIGMRELGNIPENNFKKDDKVSLMHIAICKILSYSGHYELKGKDDEGWPHWELVKQMPNMNTFEQETYIREHVIEYFLAEEII
ncbi:MAG: hypothetical protein HQ463_01575 [Bacteroidetes bacterium]|nr:hypothetical protein [Bacteroidota bacterium]